MKINRTSRCFTLLALSALTLVGCSTTTVKLTGTPGTQLSGHFRATHASSDFAGSPSWKMDLGNQQLEELEFRKGNPQDTVHLEIRKGRTQLVHATAEPGTPGLRVTRTNAWQVEQLK